MSELDCWCGHPISNHRPTAPNPTSGRMEPVIVVHRGECQTQWTERGGMDRAHCNCERYAPALADDK